MANTSKRGFASMDGEKQRLIASKGGKAAHAKGTAHEWSSEEARAAGRKGGESRGTRVQHLAPQAAGMSDHAGPNQAIALPAGQQNVASTTPAFLSDAGSSLRKNEPVDPRTVENPQQNTQQNANYPANNVPNPARNPYTNQVTPGLLENTNKNSGAVRAA